MELATKFIHAGVEPDPSTGAIMTPIYQTSTYVQRAPGEHQGYEYSRTGNPTRNTLEDAIGAAEKCRHGVVFGSGLAAADAVLRLLRPGDKVVVHHDLYGGTYRLMTQVFDVWGLKFRFVDLTDPYTIKAAITEDTNMVWIETPTNPLMSVVDLKTVCDRSLDVQALVVVDNTFATPFLQNPRDYGASIVLHSATKYLGGHSDLVLGALAVNDRGLYKQLKFLQNAVGAVAGPMDCFLALRGLKTLHVRMERHCSNARQIAMFLNNHPKVGQVNYPGLADDPSHQLAKRQMRDFGGMLSFSTLSDSQEDAFKVMQATKLFKLAESLGGVESLIGHPASMTHAAIPREERLRAGLRDSLIRLSVGIEDVNDLIADLDQALEQL